jgi:transaldolase
MNAAMRLNEMGQRIWLDNLTRDLLSKGTLKTYMHEYDLSGLTSNPSIFEAAMGKGDAYDAQIASAAAAKSGEEVFFDIALDDVGAAADLFLPLHRQTQGLDGWVSLEVSPLIAHDAAATLAAAVSLHARAARPNVFIKIPGTPEGLVAIEEAIAAGIPINVTLLFSREQYLAAAKAYLRGIERRIEAKLDPKVASVASLFVSRWDGAANPQVPAELANKLGIAIAQRTYVAYRELLASPQWRRLSEAGAMPQRLLWASTGTKDPAASDTLYIDALTAPNTITTVPDKTLLAFGEHGTVNGSMPPEGGDCEQVIAAFAKAGIDVDALSLQLLKEGEASFSKSWAGLLKTIADKRGHAAR